MIRPRRAGFDLRASQNFFEELAEMKAVRKEKVAMALVGMRVDCRTLSYEHLTEFLQEFDMPLITCIRSAQRYVQACETGTTLFDTRTPDDVDFEQWKPLLDWIVTRLPVCE